MLAANRPSIQHTKRYIIMQNNHMNWFSYQHHAAGPNEEWFFDVTDIACLAFSFCGFQLPMGFDVGANHGKCYLISIYKFIF